MTVEGKDKKAQFFSSLLQSGILFSVITFATSLGNFAVQRLQAKRLPENGDFADANSAITALIPLLSILSATASVAVSHYIAHFSGQNDAARLESLLAGCRKFLLRLTIIGSVLALVLIQPLGDYFHFNKTMMLAVLVNTLLTLWSAFVMALCWGLGWFKRLALIGFLTVALKFILVWIFTELWAAAEMVVLATAFAYLANLILLRWRGELAMRGQPVSPWNAEFTHFFIVSAAFTVGNLCFFQGDLFVAQHVFTANESAPFIAAGILARALPTTVQPMFFVLFTSRTVKQTGDALKDQLKLLALSGIGLVIGAVLLVLLRVLALKVTGRYSPEAAADITPFAITMVFVGLLQSLAFWVLASRWLNIALFYGALGIGYWLALQTLGKDAATILKVMPVAAGIAFAALFAAWLNAMRKDRKE